MDFSTRSLKSLVSDMSTVFTRAKQFAEETIGTAERTELDQEYETLAERSDTYKQWTERVVSKLEAVVQPNPNMRYGEMLIEKIGTEIKRDRLRNLEYLGSDMIDAGIAFGPSTIYGGALVKVGKAQQCLGQAEKEFVQEAYRAIIIPLRKFLDEDMKTIAKERKVLETKRLDLDAAKNRLRKAKSLESQSNSERDLINAQEEFNRQIEITKLLLEGISSAQANHVRCLNDFVRAQIEFYNESFGHMVNLQRELSEPFLEMTTPLPQLSTSRNTTNGTIQLHNSNASLINSISSTNNRVSTLQFQTQPLQASSILRRSPSDETYHLPDLPNGKRRARCLNDYQAQNDGELSLQTNEVIVVSFDSQSNDTDWMIGERLGGERGKVPVAYLEILN